jgi:hypothetical protein
MENIFENTQGSISVDLADFYNKSFMVNGDANLASMMPSDNPSIPDNVDKFSKLTSELNNNSKVMNEKFSNPQGNFNDPFAEAKIYGFNPSFKGLNMARYDDKELGFDPFRDNEKFYNENTSIFYDFERAFGGMGRLAGGAFVDSATSLGRMIQGDFDISEDFALDSERIMAETMSTKSGFLPGVANFVANSGFTLGMMAEMVAEESLILGASLLLGPESGGTSIGAGGYLAALRGQMALTKVGAAWKGMGSLRKALTSLDNVNDAKRYFTQFGKNTVDFFNPLRNTTDLFVGGNKLAGLGQMAQLSKGFGAFFRDIIDMNRSLSEARLEGGFVYNKMFEDLVNEHIERTGKEPTPQEIEGIKSISHTAGINTELINLPVIHYTNNIVFGNLSKPLSKFIGGLDEMRFLGSKFGFVGDTFQELEKGFIQTTRRSLNPRNIARNSLNYFSANLAEGLQESFQEATALATEDYYKKLYFNENSLSKKMYELSWLDSYGKGIGAQFSSQGFEVFASGFFMGGVMNKMSKAIFKSYDYVHETISDKRAQTKAAKDPEFKVQYEQQKLQKEQRIAEAKKNLVEGMNAMYSDPNKLFAPDLENMTAQEILERKIRVAGANNDRKFLIDFTDESFFKHVQTALQTGKFNSLIERIEGRLNLNDDELAQAMGVKDGTAARARLEVSIDRAKEIKRRYDLAPKNPIDLSRLKPNTKEYYEASILKHSFDLSVQDMMFSQISFDRKLERMENITRDFANSDIISNAPAAPLMHLFGLENMLVEYQLLESEIDSFDPNDPKSKKIIDEKTSLKDKLDNLFIKIKEFKKYDKETRANEEMAGEDIQNPKYAEAIREAFASYLEEYAKVNKAYVKADNLDNAFELLYDYYRLGNDMDTLSRSVAVVSNPNFIKEEAARKFTTLKKIHENRKEYIKKSVDKFFELITLNDVFAKLKDLGVAVDPEEALEFNLRQGNYTFTKFVNAKTLEPISKSDPLMEKINKIMSDYEKEVGITEKKEKAAKEAERVKKEEEAKKEAEEAKKAETKPVDDILAGLDSKTVKELRDAYNDIERDDKESFEEFLDSPQAQRIIAASKRGKEPEEQPGEQPSQVSIDAKEKLKQIWNSIGNGPGRSALEEGWAESFGYLGETLSVGGQNYQAHGMGKSGFPAALRDLFELFDKGIDSSRGGGQLYTAPLAISEENKAAASAIGTSGGTAYTDGAFVLVAKKGIVSIKSIDDIAGILVNSGLTDINPEIVTELRKVFPNLIIENYKNAKSLVEQLNEKVEIVSTDAKADVEQFNAAKESALKKIKNSTNPQTIFSEINRLQEALKKSKSFVLTSEEQTFIDEKLKELKDKGYTFKTKKGEVLREGENVRVDDNRTLLKAIDITEVEKPIIEKELNRRKNLKQELIKNGYSEEEATVQAGLSLEDNIDIVSQDIEVAVFKDGVQEKSGKVAVRFISVKDAELAALEGKPTSVSTDAKADIERRRQEDLNKFGSTSWGSNLKQPFLEKFGVEVNGWGSDTTGTYGGSNPNNDKFTVFDLRQIINAKYDAELDALKGAKPTEIKTESELPSNIEPVKPKVEAELTEEEVNILVDLEPKSPFAELDPLYSSDEFILTEDGKFYFNQSKPKQKAKRVSELKLEFSGDKRKGAIAAERGNIIDFLIRRFFEDRITADNINSAAEAFRKAYGKKKITFEPGFFDQMFESFQLIKEEFDQKGWTIVSNLPTLFGTLGVDLYAGTTDLLARDKDGNYFIIDLKTSGSSRRADYEKQLLGESNYGYSTADRIQQNAYRELLKQRTGIEVKGLFILPLIVDGNIGIISGKFDSVELDTPADGSYLLPIDMSKNIYEIVPDKFTFEQVEQIEQEFPVSSQIAGKIVYASPGIGKSTLVSQYPNQFVDMDQLLAEEFTSLGYEGFTADNVGSKVYDLFRTADYDQVKDIVDNAYRNAFDRAKEMTKTGVTVLTGSPRFLVGKGSMRYVDLAVIASDENIIRKQLERKNPQATPQEITDLVNRIRTDEKNANVLIEVNSDEFISFIQGTLPISSYIINANTNSQILNIEKLIPVTVSEEDLAIFMAKKQLMLDRKQMFEQVEAGDIVELSINDGKETVALVVDRVIPYYKNQTKILFKPNSNKIKDLIPAKSFSIVSISKANIMPTKPDVSEEAEKNAKDNVTKMDDFTSETDRLKKLLEEDFNEDDLFNGAEDPINCTNSIKPE